MGEYISSVKGSGLFCVYGLVAWDKDQGFGKCICNGKDSIITVQLW